MRGHRGPWWSQGWGDTVVPREEVGGTPVSSVVPGDWRDTGVPGRGVSGGDTGVPSGPRGVRGHRGPWRGVGGCRASPGLGLGDPGDVPRAWGVALRGQGGPRWGFLGLFSPSGVSIEKFKR